MFSHSLFKNLQLKNRPMVEKKVTCFHKRHHKVLQSDVLACLFVISYWKLFSLIFVNEHNVLHVQSCPLSRQLQLLLTQMCELKVQPFKAKPNLGKALIKLHLLFDKEGLTEWIADIQQLTYNFTWKLWTCWKSSWNLFSYRLRQQYIRFLSET